MLGSCCLLLRSVGFSASASIAISAWSRVCGLIADHFPLYILYHLSTLEIQSRRRPDVLQVHISQRGVDAVKVRGSLCSRWPANDRFPDGHRRTVFLSDF